MAQETNIKNPAIPFMRDLLRAALAELPAKVANPMADYLVVKILERLEELQTSALADRSNGRR